MAAFLLQIIFLAVSTLSNLVSRLVFNLTAYLLVLAIQAFKVPGEAIHGVLEQVREVIKACSEFAMQLLMEAVSGVISTLFDVFKESISGSALATGSAIGGLAAQTKTWLDGMLEDFPEVLEAFQEMILTMLTDLWNNYKDAVGYVTENT